MSGKFNSLIQYYFKSDTIYRLHSPGFYDLATKVFEDEDYYYDFDLIQGHYQHLIRMDQMVEGSEFAVNRSQSGQNLGSFAKRALHSPEHLYKLYKLIKWFKPQQILEFGTCLGMSSLCMQLAMPSAKVITVEGNPQFVQIAQQIHRRANCKDIVVLNSSFDHAMSQLKDERFDFVLVDGDHSFQSTCSLIANICSQLNDRSMVILDDIHWSSEMYQAWSQIRHLKNFQCSLETLRWGILFTDKSLSSIHYNLIPTAYKIWQKFV